MRLQINYLIAFFILSLVTPYKGATQEKPEFAFTCDIHRVYNGLAISRYDLKNATTLSDLNRHYKAEWVKEYYKVEIETIKDGKSMVSIGNSDTLTKDQKENMAMAESGTDIKVRVKYMPDNSLSSNEPKEMNFSINVDPDRMAQFAGGSADLQQFLQKKVLGHVDRSAFKKHKLTAIKFTVDQAGHVTDAYVFQSSGHQETDQILLKSICDMPRWSPAEYGDGLRVEQDYVLAIGDEYSCTMNLLNIDVSKLMH